MEKVGRFPRALPQGSCRNFEGLCARGEGGGGLSQWYLAGGQRKEKGKAWVLPLFKVTELIKSETELALIMDESF